MIWGSPRRQHIWLAVGARTFALLTLAMPLLLSQNNLLLMALLATGAIWAAVTAGELLEIPSTLLLVLDSALIGSGAGLCHTRPPPSSVRWPCRRSPPGSAGAPAASRSRCRPSS